MYRNLLICLFASIALVCAQSTATSAPNSPSSNSTSSSNSTTEAPTNSTTAQTTKTTTLPPTTTTAKPNTTTGAPTPAPTPRPIPKINPFSGNVTEGNNTCINVQFSVQITIKYNNSHNEEMTTGFTIPANATVSSQSSHCSQVNKTSLEAITISFDNDEDTSANLTLTFNKTDNSVFAEGVQLSFKATSGLMPQLDDKLIGTTLSAAKSQLSLFKVASQHSYLCGAAQSASLDSVTSDRVISVQVQFTDSKVEAYIDESKGGKFDSEIDCKSADISDVVPIAVGAALAGLVIIVLIAYFIGRRRSRRLAYQSV